MRSTLHVCTQERLLVTTSRWEMLAMLGCWGTVFSGAQVSIEPHTADGHDHLLVRHPCIDVSTVVLSVIHA